MGKTFIAVSFIFALLLSALVGAWPVNLGRANPYIYNSVIEGEVAPPTVGARSPTVSIFSPGNNTAYASNNVFLNFSVSNATAHGDPLRLVELYYRASWEQLKNVSVWSPLYSSLPVQLSINLTSVPEGSHWLEVYAAAEGDIMTHQETVGIFFTQYYGIFKLIGSSVVNFDVDMTPPSVTVLSLQNKEYRTSDVPLNFSVNEPVTQIGYSLDGQDNVTVNGNTSLTGLAVGEHNVTVYAADVAGNIGSSETITFIVAKPESFLTAPVAAASMTAVVAVASLLVYFKKRKSWRL